MTKTATVHAQQKWEYMEVSAKTDSYLLGELNDAGQQGWETTTITQTKDRKGELVWIAFLKRPFVPGVSTPQKDPREAAQPEQEEHKVVPTDTGEGFDFDEDDIHFKDETEEEEEEEEEQKT